MSHADKYLKTLKAAGLGQIRFFPELGGGTHALGVENVLGVHILISQEGSLPEDDDENPFGGEWDVSLYGPEGGFLLVELNVDPAQPLFDGTPERWVEVIRGALGYLYSTYAIREANDTMLPFGHREVAAGHILYSLYDGIEENSDLQGATWEAFRYGDDTDAFEILLDAITPAFVKTGASQSGDVNWSNVKATVEHLYRNNPILSGDEAAEAGFGSFEEGLLGFLKFTADIPTENRPEVIRS